MPRKDRRLDGPNFLRSVRSVRRALDAFHFGPRGSRHGLTEQQLFHAYGAAWRPGGVTELELLKGIGVREADRRIAEANSRQFAKFASR